MEKKMEFVETKFEEAAYHMYHESNNKLEKRPVSEVESVKIAKYYFDIAGLDNDQLEDALQEVQNKEAIKTLDLKDLTRRYREQWENLSKKHKQMIDEPDFPHE